VAVFASPAEFLAVHDPDVPGCLLLDVDMPDLSGPELQRALGGREGTRPIIFLSGRASVRVSVEAMKDGAMDFLTKPVRDEVLLAAVRVRLDRVARIAQRNWRELRRASPPSPREREVLEHVITGELNKQIAGALDRSNTRSNFTGRVMEIQVQSDRTGAPVERTRPSSIEQRYNRRNWHPGMASDVSTPPLIAVDDEAPGASAAPPVAAGMSVAP
jgi:FixJ family two-component response regulator